MARMSESDLVMLGKGPYKKFIRECKPEASSRRERGITSVKDSAFKHKKDTSKDHEYLDRPNFHPGRK